MAHQLDQVDALNGVTDYGRSSDVRENGERLRLTANGNGADALATLPNHWVLPTAASFGWTVEAAAANPLRSAYLNESGI